MSDQWFSPSEKLPYVGTTVEVTRSDGSVARLVYEKGLWWFPDRSMYVYYAPERWRNIDSGK